MSNDVRRVRDAARKEATGQKKTESLYWIALLLPLAGLCAGSFMRAVDAVSNSADGRGGPASAEIAERIARAQPGTVEGASQVFAALADEQSDLTARLTLYHAVTSAIRNCKRAEQGDGPYAAMLDAYRDRNAGAAEALRVAIERNAETEATEFNRLRDRMDSAIAAEAVRDAAKSAALTARAAAPPASAIAALSGDPDQASGVDPAACRALAEELAAGRHDLAAAPIRS